MNKRGFTLVEVLIATAIFTLAAVIASNILLDTIRMEERISVQNDLYQDVQSIMQSLVQEIENGTIDYEEYYSASVIQRPEVVGVDGVLLGINYGVYASRFYDPGRRGAGGAGSNPADLGTECSVIDEEENCELVWTHSTDLNTGKFPYNGSGDLSNAFCEEGDGVYCDEVERNKVTISQATSPSPVLFLIDESGTKKTMVGRKLVSGSDYVLGVMRMSGRDFDQNGVIDVFSCDEEFNCLDDAGVIDAAIEYPFEELPEDLRLAQLNDLQKPLDINTTQFVPISPLRTTIKDLQFIVRPVDNPYRAYSEDNQQLHPTVTIVMTVGLAQEVAAEYPGELPDITVQTTVAVGVNEDIVSYPPVLDNVREFGSNDKSWIWEVLSPAGLGE